MTTPAKLPLPDLVAKINSEHAACLAGAGAGDREGDAAKADDRSRGEGELRRVAIDDTAVTIPEDFDARLAAAREFVDARLAAARDSGDPVAVANVFRAHHEEFKARFKALGLWPPDDGAANGAANGISRACPTKSKGRPPTPRLAALDERLIALVDQYRPIGVRGVFYRAEVIGLVPKTEAAVDQIQRRLLRLRRQGRIPYESIVDDSREVYGAERYGGLDELAEEVAGLYRRDYWRHADCWVQVWAEKRTLKGVISPVVNNKWGLKIYSCNGQLSESLLYRGGSDIRRRGVPTYVLVLSDFDMAGGDIYKAIALGSKHAPGGISRFTGGVPVEVEKLALTAEQVKEWRLPTRPAKKGDKRSKKFIEEHGDISVELEALAPDTLRDLVDGAVARHMPARQLEALKAVEKEERRAARSVLQGAARGFGDG
jgi:hypothetical protein